MYSKIIVTHPLRTELDLNITSGCTSQTRDKLQRVLNCNCSVRFMFGGDSRHHVTSLLRDHLHWLRARERISFKLCLLVYKAVHGLAPWYLNEMCIPLSTVPNLFPLRSAARGDSVVPRRRLQFGNWAFRDAGPVVGNSLLLDIRSAPTLSTFKNMLSTSTLTFLHYWLTVSRVHVTAPCKLSFF